MNNKINNLSQVNNNLNQNTNEGRVELQNFHNGGQYSNVNGNLQNNINESQFSFNQNQPTFPVNNGPTFKIIPRNDFNNTNQSGLNQN